MLPTLITQTNTEEGLIIGTQSNIQKENMLTTSSLETIKVAILAFEAQAERTRKVLETNNIHIAFTEKIDVSGDYNTIQAGTALMDQNVQTREMQKLD